MFICFCPKTTQFWEQTGLKIFFLTFKTFSIRIKFPFHSPQYATQETEKTVLSICNRQKVLKGNPIFKLHFSYRNMTLKVFGWFMFHDRFNLKPEICQYLANVLGIEQFG